MTVRSPIIAGGSDSAETFRLATLGLWLPASQINARTGVTTPPVLTGTGSFTCTVGPFSGVIDGTSNSLQGAYPVTLDVATTVTINAANTQARIDLISLQIQDDAYDGSGAHAGRLLYTAGTPGSGSAPAAPANSIGLFTVPVGANATSVNFASATAVYPFTAAAGGVVPVRSAADKPAAVNGVGLRWRLDVTGAPGAVTPLEWSTDGTTYTPVFDPSALFGTWTNLTPSGGFISSVSPQYRTAPGNKIELRGRMTVNGAIGSGTTVVSGLPAPSSNRLMPFPSAGASCSLNLLASNTSAVVSMSGTLADGTLVGLDGLSYTL